MAKRAKRVVVYNILHTKEVKIRSEYLCPHCKTTFVWGGLSKMVTRFRCGNCGQELICKFEDRRGNE